MGSHNPNAGFFIHLQDHKLIRQPLNGSKNPPGCEHFIPPFEMGEKLPVAFVLFLLGANEEEIKQQAQQDEGKKLLQSRGFWRGLFRQNSRREKDAEKHKKGIAKIISHKNRLSVPQGDILS